MKQDWQITLEKGHERDSTRIATRIANEVSWLKLWDAMLDETVRLQSLYKVITWPKVGNISVCPVCECESNTHLLPHLLEIHLYTTKGRGHHYSANTSASTRDILLVAI